MKKTYISVDVEASGKIPGKYSMLSIGACIVYDISKQFYVELKPLNSALYDEGAMRVGSLGLECLLKKPYLEQYDPASSNFNPEMVLNVLAREGIEPAAAMQQFADWIRKESSGYRPIMAATPIAFDGMFINWYFGNFYPAENPFSHSGEDIASLARGVAGSINASLRDIANISDERKPAHNALQDAIYQAQQCQKVLQLMKQKH